MIDDAHQWLSLAQLQSCSRDSLADELDAESEAEEEFIEDDDDDVSDRDDDTSDDDVEQRIKQSETEHLLCFPFL